MLGCDGGLLILNLQRLFSTRDARSIEVPPLVGRIKGHQAPPFSSPACHSELCQHKKPQYDDDFMKIAPGKEGAGKATARPDLIDDCSQSVQMQHSNHTASRIDRDYSYFSRHSAEGVPESDTSNPC